MRRAPIAGLVLALCSSCPTSGVAQTVVALPAPDLSAVHPPAVDPLSAALDAERIVNTNDSLAFSPELAPAAVRVETDLGSGFVRSILESDFGRTGLAGVLFHRRVIVYLLLAAGAVALELLYRRGATGLVELPVPALAMAGGRSLPVVGDEHPVGRLSVRFSQRAAGIAILFHLLLVGTWAVARNLPRPVAATVALGPPIVYRPQPPPVLVPEPAEPMAGVPDISGEKVGRPEPVETGMAADQTIAPIGEIPGLVRNGDGSRGVFDGSKVVWVDPGRALEPTLIPEPKPIIPGAVPILVHMPTPVYPEIARTAEVQGTVVLQLQVGPDGSVLDVRVLRGHPMLNEAAIQAARAARFRPATQQGRPVPVWVQFPVRFSLY